MYMNIFMQLNDGLEVKCCISNDVSWKNIV